jgi:hypothetical protein
MINQALNDVNDNWNCANMAAACNGQSIPEQYKSEGDKDNVQNFADILRSDYSEVDPGNSKIGNVITYKMNAEGQKLLSKELTEENMKKFIGGLEKYMSDNKMTNEQKVKIRKDLKDKNSGLYKQIYNQFKTQNDKSAKIETHFAVIVLKTKDGSKPLSVVQDFGKNPNTHSVDPAVTPKGYVEKPVVNRTKSIYNKN